jgi:hypothetical protein
MTDESGNAADSASATTRHFKLTPAEVREHVRFYMEASTKDADPQMKRALLGVAFALSQLAECVERLTETE